MLISDHSDHYIVFTIQHRTTSAKVPTHREMRDFSEQNISKLKKKIKNTIWDKFYAILLAQDAYLASIICKNHINNYFKECFPNKKVKTNYRNKITWIGAELNPIRSGGGGGFKSPPLRFFAFTHLILELHYCALVTFPKK